MRCNIWLSGFLLMSALFILGIHSTDGDHPKSKCPELDCAEECQCYRSDENNCRTCECFETMGDICLTDEQYAMIQKAKEDGGKDDGTVDAVSNVQRRWDNRPDGNGFFRIPYVYGDGVVSDASGRDAINAAMGVIYALTCIKFDPLEEGETGAYINFANGGGCSSAVGRVTSGGQQITLAPGCRNPGTVLHEILHALGVWHEQSRPDRDQYVRILLENIPEGNRHNFDIVPQGQVNYYGSPYDFRSVMHYSSYAFSSNGMPTIVESSTDETFATQRHMLSQEDIYQINAHYGCGVKGIPFTDDCYNPLDRGVSYSGTRNVTSTGTACIRWDSLSNTFNSEVTTGAGLAENYCRNPDVDSNGPWCFVSSNSLQYCDIPLCDPFVDKIPEPNPPMWSEFGNWTECLGECGNGFQHRFRSCLFGDAGSDGCEGNTFETRSCDLDPCPSTTTPPPTESPSTQTPSGIWRNWERYSSCDEPCGTGLRHRTRRCRSGICVGDVIQSEACNSTYCPVYPDGDCFNKKVRDSYRGNATLARKRRIDRTCINWNGTNTLPADYPDKDLRGNLCRNPKNRWRPYCHYTKTKIANCIVSVCNTGRWRRWGKWSFCDSSCGGGVQYRTRTCRTGGVTENRCTGVVIQERACNDNACPTTTPTTNSTTTTTTPAINCADLSDVQSYRGTISTTRGGDVCQRWDSQSPNQHSFTAQDRLDFDLTENYCRAPDSDEIYPYCYSSEQSGRFYCDVPMCEPNPPLPLNPGGCYDPSNKQSYYGDVTMTIDGDECMRWDGNDPYVHSYKPYTYPDKGLGPHNYCRNPDNDNRPWCVTTNPQKFWNYCDVPIC